MSSSNATLAEINYITYVNQVINQFYSYFLICFGTIGHLLNIYVFTRPILYSNPCARYFLAATISGFLVATINIPMRLVQSTYPMYNPFGYSTASCKILTYATACVKAYPNWFIVFACVDRFLCSSTSVNVRQWSNLRIVNRIILLIIIIIGLFYLYILIVFENIQTHTKCPYTQTTYPLFHGIWNLLIFSLGPSLLMLIFGLLSIRNIQRSLQKVAVQKSQSRTQSEPMSPLQNQLKSKKTTDRQLIQMMLIQCFYFISTTTPFSVASIYTALRINIQKDSLQTVKDNMFTILVGLVSSTSACTTFYCFTLSSQLFRQQLKKLFNYHRK
ncbi:unnamed protein product [Adineta ricciae]|uniref:G-protein coupled receptors family 1 profile domain-containing protein n=1 Tax=Adineta ricciae TaxID=249248 RepID=A0A815Z6C6_ADIRI|nr:unnamed protein product [Adineta ricciae]CAF1578354.1 unnamed protein product [Adineta ricciae]